MISMLTEHERGKSCFFSRADFLSCSFTPIHPKECVNLQVHWHLVSMDATGYVAQPPRLLASPERRSHFQNAVAEWKAAIEAVRRGVVEGSAPRRREEDGGVSVAAPIKKPFFCRLKSFYSHFFD